MREGAVLERVFVIVQNNPQCMLNPSVEYNDFSVEDRVRRCLSQFILKIIECHSYCMERHLNIPNPLLKMHSQKVKIRKWNSVSNENFMNNHTKNINSPIHFESWTSKNSDVILWTSIKAMNHFRNWLRMNSI